MLGCNCTNGLSNTGRPNCVPIHAVTSTLILVAITANDGTKNAIDLTLPLPTWNDLINQADASKRWFPLPQFENVELPKADSQFEEAKSGRKVFLRQGKRSFKGELWAEDSSPTLLGKLKGNRCVDFGVYHVDVNGSLIGTQVGTKLYPIPVDVQSFDPKYIFATDDTTSKIEVSFDYNRLFDESTMYMLTSEEAGVNFNELEGLIDVNFTSVVVAATTITFDASLDYGTALNKIKFQGALPADFALQNETTGLAVALSGVVENTAGNYTATFVAQTTGDVGTLSLSKDGFIGSVSVVFA